jgi:mono/diheme cytochrome c family protein
VDSVPGIGQLALTTLAAHRERDPSAPVDDAARVQAGGEVYSQACARCHGATVGPSVAAVADLSDEQIAALAAFLLRHAAALPGRRERPRPTL